MTLDILISTIDNGINRVSDILLQPRDDVKYIISHQYRSQEFIGIPEKLIRDDVLVSQIHGQGLTKSRNHAIKLATGDICLIADDDVRYNSSYFDRIFEVYRNNKVDVACFKTFKENGVIDYKYYPSHEYQIRSIFNYSPSSIEITFKRVSIVENKVEFDERFGLGSYLNGGGENLFIHDCIAKGLMIKFYPLYIVEHPHASQILLIPKYHKKRNLITGAIDARINGVLAFFKILPRTLMILGDLVKHKKNPLAYMFETAKGMFYIIKSNR